MVRRIVVCVLGVGGAASVVLGVAMVSPPLAFVVGGTIALATVWWETKGN